MAHEVTVRAGAKVVAAVAVNRPDGLDELAELHIWTPESVQVDRLDFRPRHRLTVLVVQAIPLVEPEATHIIGLAMADREPLLPVTRAMLDVARHIAGKLDRRLAVTDRLAAVADGSRKVRALTRKR